MKLRCLTMYLIGGLTISLVWLPSRTKAVDFNEQIQPILVSRCGKCHGEEKALARLRLHSAEAIGALEKPKLLVAGDPDGSTLYQRITLPADDKKRMPKEGDPLTDEQIELIRQWIEEGAALGDQPSDAPPGDGEDAAADPTADELDDLQPASQEAIDAIAATGAQVSTLAQDSPLLQVSYARRNPPADDAALKPLAGAAPQIAWLDLTGAQITLEGMQTIGQLENLSRLHLEKSSVDDAGLSALTELQRLAYLNLYGTGVTDAGIQHLNGLDKLRRLYLWQTNVSYAAAKELEQAVPSLETNLGWNHPEVVWERITEEVDRLQQALEESTARVTELEQQMKAAEEQRAQLEERLEEAKEQLKDIDESPEGTTSG